VEPHLIRVLADEEESCGDDFTRAGHLPALSDNCKDASRWTKKAALVKRILNVPHGLGHSKLVLLFLVHRKHAIPKYSLASFQPFCCCYIR
jgi:hypothetical protein